MKLWIWIGVVFSTWEDLGYTVRLRVNFSSLQRRAQENTLYYLTSTRQYMILRNKKFGLISTDSSSPTKFGAKWYYVAHDQIRYRSKLFETTQNPKLDASQGHAQPDVVPEQRLMSAESLDASQGHAQPDVVPELQKSSSVFSDFITVDNPAQARDASASEDEGGFPKSRTGLVDLNPEDIAHLVLI